MAFITDLWMPILVSAALVFVASSIIWMALPIHKHDYKMLREKEEPVMDAVRSVGVGPGVYMFPACDPQTLKDNPAAQGRFKAGPWGLLMVQAGPPNMGKLLGAWTVNLLLTSALVAYVAWHALPGGAEYLRVFQMVGAAAFLAYCGNALTERIWKGQPWAQLPGTLFDGVVYSLLTAGTFGWLWPDVLTGR